MHGVILWDILDVYFHKLQFSFVCNHATDLGLQSSKSVFWPDFVNCQWCNKNKYPVLHADRAFT